MALSVLEQRDQLGVQPGRLFIDGVWADASDEGTWEQLNPATNEVVTSFAIASTRFRFRPCSSISSLLHIAS